MKLSALFSVTSSSIFRLTRSRLFTSTSTSSATVSTTSSSSSSLPFEIAFPQKPTSSSSYSSSDPPKSKRTFEPLAHFTLKDPRVRTSTFMTVTAYVGYFFYMKGEEQNTEIEKIKVETSRFAQQRAQEEENSKIFKQNLREKVPALVAEIRHMDRDSEKNDEQVLQTKLIEEKLRDWIISSLPNKTDSHLVEQ